MENGSIPTGSSHVPSYLQKMSIKENNMINTTTNRELTAISGSSGYGSAGKQEFEVEIRTAEILDGFSLQLRGKVKVNHTAYNKDVLFNSSAYSMVEQITADINGQSVLLLNQDAEHIAHMNRVNHSSFTQFENDDVMALAGQDIKTEQSFVLDLSKYGSALEYYLLSSPVLTMKLKIRFHKDLAKVFHRGGTVAATGTVNNYEINNLRLTGDFSDFNNDAKNTLIKRYQSPTGVKMVTHSFVPQRNTLQATTNHRIQGSYQYRNLVLTRYLPVPTSILAADKEGGISKTDIVSNINFTGDALPLNMRVRMDGMNYVNENGTSGCSNKMEHLAGMLKSCLRTPGENNVGYKLCQGYKSGLYQPTGVSFVRGNDNFKDITNSGVNGFFSRGALETEFDTTVDQVNKTLLTVGVVTTTVSIENGQVSVVR